MQNKIYRSISLCMAIVALAACTTPAPVVPTTTPVVVAPVNTEPVPTEAELAQRAGLRELVDLNERMYRVASPLMVNTVPVCKRNARYVLGFWAKNKYSYTNEYMDAASKLYKLDDRLRVMGVLDSSNAADAGLQRGDILIAIEGQTLATGQNAENQAKNIVAPLVTTRRSLILTINRDGKGMDLDVPLTNTCAFTMELGNSDNVNAYNDGHRIMITRGMLKSIRDDNELALVVAREFAHGILDHARRLRNTATVAGVIDNLSHIHPDMNAVSGSSGIRPASLDMDTAADRLGLYLAARAGYSIDHAPAFWRDFNSRVPTSVANGYTAQHPSLDARLAMIDKTIAEIKAKQAAKKPLIP